MSKTKSLEEPILQQTENIHDQLNQRFSHLLVKSLISEDNSDDSDSLFKGIKTCKNVTLTRSRTYFDDDLQLFPVTPAKVSDKHALLTSDEEDGFPNSANQSSLFNSNSKVFNGTRSPLKLITHNSMVTTISTGKSARKKSNLENRPKIKIVHSSYTNENVNSNMFTSGVLSPHCTHAPIGLLSYKSAVTVDKTSVNKGKKKVPKTSTPLNKALTLSTVFKTPTSSNNTTPKLSALKRYSIDKAVASAKREIEEMMKTIKLKKRTSKSLKKRGNNSILDDTCDSPVSSTARSCLFSTPTASSNKTNDEKVTAFSMNQTPNNIQEAKKPLTGMKILDIPCKKPMNNSMNSTIEGKTTLSDDEYEDILPTQPLASILLRNVIAYVDVRYGKDCLSEGTRAELESLGAKVEKNFNRKVTHCFFHGGKMSTYRKAIEWKVPLISTLWIEACKTEMDVLPIKGYETYGLDKYREALPLYQLKTKGLRRAVTDSKIRRKPWKENESDKSTQRVTRKPLPPVPTFKKADEVVDALHSVAGDLRKATEQFEKILTSPVLQKKKDGTENSECSRSKICQSRNTTNCRRKRNKKLVFGGSSDDDNNKKDHNSSINETEDSSSKISFTNDSEVRISYDSDDLLIYAKKQAANTRSSAPSRLLNSRKCKKLLSSCKEPENKKNEEITVGNNVGLHQEGNRTRGAAIPRPTRTSKNKFRDDDKVNEKEKSSVKKTQTKKRKLLLPSQVIDDFHQDSGESTPPTSPKNPYKATPNKKPRTGLAVKSNTLRTIASVRVTSDCDSDDSLTRAARRESSALFVKKDKKTVPQKTSPTIVCTSLCRSDEEVVKSIVAELGTFTVEAAVSERTTHVVTPTPRRTINLLKGIARGCWVLNVQWVYHSLEAGQWLPEERFELTDFSPAVKLARSDRQAFGPEFGLELFTGLGPFYVCRATVPPSRDLAELLRLGGGAVVSNARVAKIVVGTTPPLSPCGRTPPVMVREKWVLDCITQLTQLPVSDYIVVSAEP